MTPSDNIMCMMSAVCIVSCTAAVPQRLPPNVPGVQHGRLRIEADTMRQLVFDPVIEPILQNVHHMLSVPRRSDGGKGADVLIMAGAWGLGSRHQAYLPSFGDLNRTQQAQA